MTCATYLQLMSALVQVFGLLGVLVAIFVIFRLDRLAEARGKLRWGLMESGLRGSERPGDEELVLLDDAAFRERIPGLISRVQTSGTPLEVTRTRFLVQRYDAVIHEITNVRRKLLWLMAVPAEACLCFSVLLYSAESLHAAAQCQIPSQALSSWSLIAIGISAGVFAWMIYNAFLMSKGIEGV
jgi:hypothetical protein